MVSNLNHEKIIRTPRLYTGEENTDVLGHRLSIQRKLHLSLPIPVGRNLTDRHSTDSSSGAQSIFTSTSNVIQALFSAPSSQSLTLAKLEWLEK